MEKAALEEGGPENRVCYDRHRLWGAKDLYHSASPEEWENGQGRGCKTLRACWYCSHYWADVKVRRMCAVLSLGLELGGRGLC